MQMMCAVISAVLNWIIYYVCCTIFFEERLKTWKNKFFYMLYAGTAMVLFLFFQLNYVTIFFEIFIPVIFFKGKVIKKEIIYWCFVYVLSVFTLIIDAIICKIMKINKIEIVEYAVTARMIFVLSLVICYYLISFLKIKTADKSSLLCTPSVFRFSVVLVLLVAIICFLVKIYKYKLPKEVLEEIENATCGIFALVISIDIISFELLKNSISLTRETMEEKEKIKFYEMQRKYDKLTAEQLKNLSSLRHDFKNHLYVLLERVRKGEQVEAIEYIEKICGCTEEADSIVMAENEILATILTVKNAVCKSKNIIFYYEISCGEIHIEDMDLNIVVANLMDNAIEASEKCREGNRKIIFKIKIIKQFLAIECINTCQEHLKPGQSELKTTKADKENHGFGMGNIKETVAKYGGRCQIMRENGMFSIKIMMENT